METKKITTVPENLAERSHIVVLQKGGNDLLFLLEIYNVIRQTPFHR